MGKGTIYVARNTVNGKRYVGQTVRSFEVRQAQHKSDSKKVDNKLYRAVRKYGWESFDWAIIVEDIESVEQLNDLEQYWIAELDSLHNGYNSNIGGGSNSGWIPSEEARKKMSEANKGENNSMYGKTGEKHPMYGKFHSEETKKKLSEVKSGKNNPMYGKTGESNPFYGKQHSEETKKKLSEAHSIPILQLNKLGNIIAEYVSAREAEGITGIHNSNISKCCKGKAKSAGGYIWKYKEG